MLYEVVIKEDNRYVVHVEAPNETVAEELAFKDELWCSTIPNSTDSVIESVSLIEEE